LNGLKFSGDEKETLRAIYENGKSKEDQNAEIHKFLKELAATKKMGYHQKKGVEKVAPLYDTHDFWDSQPVPKSTDEVQPDDFNKMIDAEKKVGDVREEPLDIPPGFYWSNVNIENDEECKEVYDLLTQNYVEDDDNMFRFDYSVKFLQWALTPPGYNKDWLFGVRGGKKDKLFGFISGIPVHVEVNGKKLVKAEINFLCVHKSLRTKRLAPVLIKEVTRRVNKCDMWTAIYTAGVVIPTPITATTYWHRSLNPKKLVEVGFSSLPSKTPMARFIKIYKLPNETSIVGFRPMEKKDIPVVTQKLNAYLQQFKFHIQFTKEEIEHFFMPREWVIESFVVEDTQTDEITDFVSFYSLPSQVLKNENHKILNVAYSYYYFTGKHSLTDLTKDVLICAKNRGYDVFNALDIMHNKEYLEELKFGVGDGNLHYYFYNWRIEKLTPQDVGMVLV
jgi:glycylpeptide N-tetradecanoyltransferase